MKVRVAVAVLLFGGLVLWGGPQGLARHRSVYVGHMVEQGQIYDSNEDRLMYNAIRWTSGKLPGETVTVAVLHSIGTMNYYMWDLFDLMHPDIEIHPLITRPIVYADLALDGADVLVVSDAWHGPSDQVPPPDPMGENWVYCDDEIEAISCYVKQGAGIVVTSGSFGQFARDLNTGCNNFGLAPLMGLKSTGGGDPLNADTFPWSRDTFPYPPNRPVTAVVFDDVLHPVAEGLPTEYFVYYGVAVAQWMQLDGAVQIGHYTDGVTQFSDSLVTAYDEDEDEDVVCDDETDETAG